MVTIHNIMRMCESVSKVFCMLVGCSSGKAV
jgi:hypothetical protein